MDATEGQKKVLRMATEREKNSTKDIYHSKVIKDEEERVLVDDLGEMEGVLPESDE